MTTPIVPNSAQLRVQGKTESAQHDRVLVEQDLMDRYSEIEPFLTWLDEHGEDEYDPKDPLVVTQGLGGLLDDAQRKAMFAKMGGNGGGDRGVGKGAVGKAVGAGKKGLSGSKGLTGKNGLGNGKGVGKGVGSAVGNAKSAVAKAASAPGKKVSNFKTARAPKVYERRMNSHAKWAARDLSSSKNSLNLAAHHHELSVQHSKTADYHKAVAHDLTGSGGAMSKIATLINVADSHGVTVSDHKMSAKEHGDSAAAHASQEANHRNSAALYANSARSHAMSYKQMKKNNPYK